MKMTRRNFISASAAAMLACGASLSAHAAENTTENGLNFITDIFKDPTQPGETEGATTITAEANAEWYEKLDFLTGGSLPTPSAAGWTTRKAGSSMVMITDLHGICRATAI